MELLKNLNRIMFSFKFNPFFATSLFGTGFTVFAVPVTYLPVKYTKFVKIYSLRQRN